MSTYVLNHDGSITQKITVNGSDRFVKLTKDGETAFEGSVSKNIVTNVLKNIV